MSTESKTTTKKDLIELLSERIGLDAQKTGAIIEEFTAVLAEEFIRGNSVVLRGNLGTFKAIRTKEKKARNIKENTAIIIPPRNDIKFSLSTEIFERMNKKY